MPAFWDTPHRPMITHTSDSHQIPSQSKTKSKLHIKIRCINMKWIQPELWVLQSGHGMRDGRTDGQNETNIPPSTLLCEGYNKYVTDGYVKLKSNELWWWSLTHLPLDKMATILQRTFSNAFSWMEIRLRFHWNLFLGLELTIFQHLFR